MENNANGSSIVSEPTIKNTATEEQIPNNINQSISLENTDESVQVAASISYKDRLLKFFEKIPITYIFAALFSGYCLINGIIMLIEQKTYINVNYPDSYSLSDIIICTLVFAVIAIAASLFTKKKQIIPWCLLISTTFYGCCLAYFAHAGIYVNIGIALILFFVSFWLAKGDKACFKKINISNKALWTATIVGVVMFTSFVSLATIFRHNSSGTATFDFGIFAQMFENMRTTGLADTTVERNQLMSHFGVHFSPIYYVLLPFYCICPRPETLLVIQALAIAVGAIPVLLICKELKLSSKVCLCVSLIYLVYPSLSSGVMFDFHENKFLTVLLLWAGYFMIKKKFIPMLVFVVLSLMVKEDAAIYIAVLAVYMIVARKEYKKGSIVLGLSVVYFLIAINVVAMLGNGVMMDRLAPYVPDGKSGFMAVANTCLTNMGYVISKIFTADKLPFILWMLLPIGFVPFMNKQKSTLILLLPMVVINLMPDWSFQYDIGYQYTYGIAALIILTFAITLPQLKPRAKRCALIFALTTCTAFCFSLFVQKGVNYTKRYLYLAEQTQTHNSIIATIPKDAEVTADGYFVPHMYDFKNLYSYPDNYNRNKITEYLVITSEDIAKPNEQLTKILPLYELVETGGNMSLYKLK